MDRYNSLKHTLGGLHICIKNIKFIYGELLGLRRLWEKGIRFRHPDYDPDRAQKSISSTMSRHLSTRNISSKSMHAFLSNPAHRQTNERGRTGENIHPPLSEVNNV